MSAAKKIQNRETFGQLIEMELPEEDVKYWQNVRENTIKNKMILIHEIETWMKNNSVGVNKLCRMLDINSRQYYRLMDPEENVTLRTIAEISTILGSNFEINFIQKK